jgi:YD repeat-containing protein
MERIEIRSTVQWELDWNAEGARVTVTQRVGRAVSLGYEIKPSDIRKKVN